MTMVSERVLSNLKSMRALLSKLTERLRTAASNVLPGSRPTGVRQNPIKEWRLVALRTLVAVAVFSLFVNLLMLTLPVYLFQISDRVLTSHSLDTLLMLSLLALSFIGVLSLLDILRRQVLGRLATNFETILGGPVLASIVTNAKASDSANIQSLRMLHQVKNFISSPVMLLLFDTPLAPIYFAAVFFIHPDLGFVALASGIVLIAIGNKAGELRSAALIHQSSALDRNFWISGAAAIIAGRALQPLEGM